MKLDLTNQNPCNNVESGHLGADHLGGESLPACPGLFIQALNQNGGDCVRVSTMKDMPFFKFDAADYLTGKVQLMDMENQGVFINLVARIWINGGAIKEDKFLARLLGCSETQLKATLSLGFDLGIIERDSDGYLCVKFLKAQISKRFDYLEKQRENGAKGGRPKNPTKPKKKEDIRNKREETRDKKKIQKESQPQKSFKNWTREDLIQQARESNHDGLLTEAELQDFADYWTGEKSASGKTKLALQKTWNTRLRMQNALRMIFEKNRRYNPADTSDPTGADYESMENARELFG